MDVNDELGEHLALTLAKYLFHMGDIKKKRLSKIHHCTAPKVIYEEASLQSRERGIITC